MKSLYLFLSDPKILTLPFEFYVHLKGLKKRAIPLGCRNPLITLFQKSGFHLMGHDSASCPVFHRLGAARVIEMAVGDQEVLDGIQFDPAGFDVLEELDL
jgi:hypothetical protein